MTSISLDSASECDSVIIVSLCLLYLNVMQTKVYLSIQIAVITGLHSFYDITVLPFEYVQHFSYRLTVDEH